MDGDAGGGNEVGDVFVTIVEVVGRGRGGREEDERTGGDGFGGIPHIGVEEGVGGGAELLDAEVVVVNEALEGFCTILHCPHFNAATHTVEGHRDHGIAGLPADRTVFGVILHRPNAGGGLDERLIAIGVVLGREVVDGDVLVEIVGGVGLAFGGDAVADIIYEHD